MPGRLRSAGSALARAVEKQMRNWELAKAQRRTVPEPRRPEVEDFIAVSRQVGAGGRSISELLGERLGWPVFDKEILQAMAGDDTIRREIYASMDERDIGWYEETLRSLIQREFVKNDYFHRLTQTVLSIARQGHGVFLGRGIDLILPRRVGFRVRLVAPKEACVKNYAERHQIPLEQAEADVPRIEAEREEFIRRHFQVEADEPTRWDLVVNTGKFAFAQATDLILDARQRTGTG
jgi:cytidylate kinase